MKYTTNYNLKKPEATDLAAISDLNDNADTIDTEIKTLNTTFVRKEFRTGSTASYKELTDNNFTDAEKAKLALLSNSTSGGENTSVFNGLTASFYGDSLTEVNSRYTKGYHSWVKDILGLASYNNYGVSGYKVSDVYTKANSITDTADVIFVMCGVNDQTFSVDLGEWGDTTTDTTYGAFYCLCNLLKTKYPTKTIIFITPHYQTTYPHSSGITSYEIGEAMKKTCDKFSIPCYDNRVMSGIYPTNLGTFTVDNCHWNDKGHEMVGKNLARWVIDNVRYVYGAKASTETDTGISLSKTELYLSRGTYETLTVYGTNQNVTWNSSNTSIATVNKDGVVTGVKDGTVTITATTEDGSYTATCVVIVVKSNITHDFEGLYCHIAKCFNSEGLVHITMTVEVDDDIKTGTKFTWELEGSETNKISSGTHSVASEIYNSSTAYADDGTYGEAIALHGGWSQTVTDDGKLTVGDADYTMKKNPSAQYLKVPICLYAEEGAYFKVDKLRLYANGVEKQILDCGAFFDSTKARIYFSKYSTTEE